MSFKDRLRRVFKATEEERVTLRCDRCGWEVRVSGEVPLMLLARVMDEDLARAVGEGDSPAPGATESVDERLHVLVHPCAGARAGSPWTFREASQGGGSIARLASVLAESCQRVERAREEPDDT